MNTETWYYLSTQRMWMDDYSRYIISWKLCRNISTEDVKDTLNITICNTGVHRLAVRYSQRLLSDNGPCYLLNLFILLEGQIPHSSAVNAFVC